MIVLNQAWNKSNVILFARLVLSCLFCGAAVSWVAVPNDLAVTGTTGLSIAISKFVPLDYTLIYYLITMVVSGIAWAVLGFQEVLRILFLAVVYPLTMFFTRFIPVRLVFEDKLAAVVLFSIFYGVGFGLSYSSNFSYGGSDTVGKLLKATVLNGLSLDQVLNLVECTIVGALLLAYPLELVIYALVAELVYVKIIDYMTNGSQGKKLVMVQITLEKGIQQGEACVDQLVELVMHKQQASLSVTQQGQLRLQYIATEREIKTSPALLEEYQYGYDILVFPVLHHHASQAISP